MDKGEKNLSLQGNAYDIPFELRANDIVRHIINIDSRFRESPKNSSSSNFYYRLLSPVRNILRIRVTSVEFPNNYYAFTALRGNVTLRIIHTLSSPTTFVVTIPDGNYTACEMTDTLNALIHPTLPWLTASFDVITGGFTFTAAASAPGYQYFVIDTTYGSVDRPFDYGLGYNLGFTLAAHAATEDASGNWFVTSDQCASFSGDNYVFLKINEFDCVRHKTYAESLTALAKIVLRDPKNYMTFDDYASQHAKEVVFPNPQDLTRFHIQVLDPYGNVLDMCSSQFSFSLEVLEVKNLTLYNTIRDSISLRYT
jgi:hypothetical protein